MINSELKKLIEDEVKAKCYDEAMTGEFSQFEENSVLLAHDQLMVEKAYEEVRAKYLNNHEKGKLSGCQDGSDQVLNSLVAGSASVQVNLLVDRVEWMD